MSDSAFRRIANSLTDRLATVWKLLSETTNVLSRTPLFSQYEAQLREWRNRLQQNPRNAEVIRDVRAHVVQLRKLLRDHHYDLSLASRDLILLGFRNDSAMREGFRRLVLYDTDLGLYIAHGEDNHIELAAQLDAALAQARIGGIRARHYLWYLWTNRVLYLAGADSESRDDYEKFRHFAEQNRVGLLQRLRKLP